MQTFKQHYWRISLFAIIIVLGITIFIEIIPFLGGLLGAITIYVLLRGQMCRLTEGYGWRRSLAASLLLGEAILCFLIPITLIVWMLVVRLQHVALDPQIVIVPLKNVAAMVHDKTGYDLWQENLSSIMSVLPKLGQWIVNSVVSFIINIIVLLFVLYFMLLGGLRMEVYVREIMPFSREVGSGVAHEVHMIVRSNAIGIPLLALVQGFVAYLGYLAFGVPSPLFWGVLTCFATIIPVVGTALVWVPLAIYMAMSGNTGMALALAVYGLVVITHVDNLVRMMLQKRMADTHPLVTIFGVVIGLALFGFMGVIFGPLLLEMFIFCVDIFKKKYLDGVADCDLFEESVADSPKP